MKNVIAITMGIIALVLTLLLFRLAYIHGGDMDNISSQTKIVTCISLVFLTLGIFILLKCRELSFKIMGILLSLAGVLFFALILSVTQTHNLDLRILLFKM